MRITIETHGITHTIDGLTDGVKLPEIIKTFCMMLEQSGWSRENIIALFNDRNDDTNEPTNNPFEWDML